jgi:hypothetical protein
MDLALVNACAGYQRLPKMTRNTVCGMLVLRLLWVKVWFKRICVLREGREEKRRKTSFPLRRRRAPGHNIYRPNLSLLYCFTAFVFWVATFQ